MAALAGLPFSLSAQIVWDGDTSTGFSDGLNWTGDIAPTAADVAAYNAVATNQPALSAASGVLGVDFQTGGWTLSGASTLTVGASGVTSTGNNAITAPIAQSGAATYSSAAGGLLDLDTISGGPVTFGTAVNTGSVSLNGGADNPSFSPTVAFGTVILNKSGTSGSSTNNLTVDAGATVQFGSMLTSRGVGGGRGQVFGTTTLEGTMDLNGQGLTRADTYNWSMNGLTGAGTVTNNGAGSAELSIRGGSSFSGAITDGTSTTAMHFHIGNYQLNGTANTYSGGTTIDGVEVILNMGNVADGLGTGDITLINGGHFKNRNNNPTINNNIVVGTGGGGIEAGWGSGDGSGKGLIINGQISGSELLTIVDDGGFTRLQNGGNSHSGGTLIQGYVQADSGALGTGDITLNGAGTSRGGIQNRNGYDVHANNVIVEAGGGLMKAGWNANLEFTGEVSGSGTLTIQEDSGRVVLSNNANTFSGNISFVGANSRLTVASLESGDYTGEISGGGTLTYAGSGPQTIASSSTISYTGSTIVSTGTLLVNADMSSSPAFIVEALGITGGSGTVQNLTIAAGGKFVFSETDTLTDTGTTTLDVNFGVDDLVGIDAETPNGIYTLIANGADFSSIENFGAANAFDLGTDALGTLKSAYFQNGSLQLVVVPEPSVSLLGALGALALLRRRRRA